EQPEMLECKEQKWRSSKPPLAKVKLGLHLDQHELSVIPEVDTPRSCSFSFPDKTDSARGESPPILPVGELACASCYSCDLHEDGRLPRSITSCEEQTFSGSPWESEHSGRLLRD
ncbi:CE295 protein, partial [Crypturellus undulatus]|nr:CE295 protein [Crypturellus undulatus]